MKSWKQRILFTIHHTPFTQRAFTLAEVLITLGILGVVIAMTIPGLMQNIQDKQFKEAAKEAFSKSSQAVRNKMKAEAWHIIMMLRLLLNLFLKNILKRP